MGESFPALVWFPANGFKNNALNSAGEVTNIVAKHSEIVKILTRAGVFSMARSLL